MQRDYAVIPTGGRNMSNPSSPVGKDHCHLSLLAQDPHSLFVWWNVPEAVLRFAAAGQPARVPLRLILRLYDVSPQVRRHSRCILTQPDRPVPTDSPQATGPSRQEPVPDAVTREATFDTALEDGQLWLDIEVGPQNALYINVPGNGRTYVAELGIYQNGAYRPLLRSLPHATPWGEPSETIDPSWPPLEMLYRTIRPLSLPSSPQGLYAP